jgi:hypothetical protein
MLKWVLSDFASRKGGFGRLVFGGTSRLTLAALIAGEDETARKTSNLLMGRSAE